ncbi:MAG TPA: cell division protein FtsZ [Candidatus Andersenbacteria bacterium]|nr:MAG: Cell division protein FtsZ [Parcubacteria group bacterium GW2011_GWA2_45_14]OGY34602.1 MAG: cell division protein FtsZ [Candidatus Andersenbacteria bacterium RIFCSPHIGHO2_02_FULL_46_16]OGY37889.1 MAG: cell division protein FtsZ [Candidatus Andersenbacteria bacterium RIFCSPLOWO2_02_FULL_46_11]HBE89941.1 cell division protein FtsZ [Candidatus Andersenbacteria bacterium]
MPLKKPTIENVANIKVVGVGGSGNAALNRMMEAKIKGVEFVAVNTDAQALHYSGAPTKLHIGQNLTRGLGAGMDPSVGQQAAEESREEIHEVLKGSDMVFVTCGFGGGTGSGAGPLISEIAKETGALTVAVVTKPFSFEGQQRMTLAEEAIAELNDRVDASVIIPNDRLLQIIDKKTSLLDAFKVVDDVLRQGVQGISDLITQHGMVNVDFADIRAIVQDAGSALMGIGRATGENRAVEAARASIASPMMDVTIDGARGIVFNITAGNDLRMFEVEEAARVITENADPNAKVIFGAVIDPEQVEEGEIKITVVATGFEKPELIRQQRERYSGSVQFSPPAGMGQVRSTAPMSRPMEPLPPASTEAHTIMYPSRVAEQMPTDNRVEEEDLDVPTFIRRKMREQKESRSRGEEPQV